MIRFRERAFSGPARLRHGGLWWWIHARSEREIVETFAEVEVVTDPEAAARFPDGTAIRTGPEDWLVNPANDLYDPDLAQGEISAADVEETWQHARREGE